VEQSLELDNVDSDAWVVVAGDGADFAEAANWRTQATPS